MVLGRAVIVLLDRELSELDGINDLNAVEVTTLVVLLGKLLNELDGIKAVDITTLVYVCSTDDNGLDDMSTEELVLYKTLLLKE